MTEPTYSKGLAGVIADESKICKIDGEAGLLMYRGYTIEDLAAQSSFAESAYLLLHGELPTRDELSSFDEKLAGFRGIDDAVVGALRALGDSAHPMVALQTGIAAHAAHGEVAGGPDEGNIERAVQIIARFPTIVAASHRLAKGLDPIAPRGDLGHGQNFLYMLSGEVPDEEIGEIFETCLILHMEHSFNASTFTGRVVAATLAPLDASISAAVGALYGPLHGGANEKVLAMLEEIPSVDAVEAWADEALDQKKRIMGMGHRVYKTTDPRAFVLEDLLVRASKKRGETESYKKLKKLEAHVVKRLEQEGKSIYPNVDYFSGSLYDILGIEKALFTPIFAIARVVGWCAHILELWQDNRLYRPRAHYTGPTQRPYVPVAERG